MAKATAAIVAALFQVVSFRRCTATIPRAAIQTSPIIGIYNHNGYARRGRQETLSKALRVLASRGTFNGGRVERGSTLKSV